MQSFTSSEPQQISFVLFCFLFSITSCCMYYFEVPTSLMKVALYRLWITLQFITGKLNGTNGPHISIFGQEIQQEQAVFNVEMILDQMLQWSNFLWVPQNKIFNFTKQLLLYANIWLIVEHLPYKFIRVVSFQRPQKTHLTGPPVWRVWYGTLLLKAGLKTLLKIKYIYFFFDCGSSRYIFIKLYLDWRRAIE